MERIVININTKSYLIEKVNDKYLYNSKEYSFDDAYDADVYFQEIDYQVRTYRASWITGRSDINQEWDGFVKTLDSLGLNEYMEILQNAQDIYGYLPVDVILHISQRTGIKVTKIMGVATFYSQFALNPKGKYQISVCLGTACYVKGAGDIYNKLEELLGIKGGECTPDGKFSLDACRCVGACGLAPVLTVNDEVYGKLVGDDIPGILEKYMA